MDFTKLRSIIFFAALGIISIVFLYIIKPLFYPIFWAAVIASIFYPLYNHIRRRLKSNNWSAAIILLMVVVIVLVPLAIISSLLIKESIDIYNEIGDKSGQIQTSIQNAINTVKSNPLISKLNIDESFWIQKISDVTGSLTSYIFTSLKNITENSVTFLIMFVIMLYTLYYFIRDGEKLLRRIMLLSPIGDKQEIIFYEKFTSTARASIKGTVVLGLVQGILGGIMFYIAGIKGALIWTLVMTVFSVLIGSYFVWLPAAIIMLTLGAIWQGVFILIFGTLVISTIDNLLRPILVGKDIQMHPLLIFLSTLGGLVVFGLSGFVIGPIITAFLMTFWEMYEHYYKTDLEKND